MLNTNNLWFLAIFFAMSFGSWVLGQLREQAKLKKARDEAARRYDEQLRTGRSEASRTPQPAAPTQSTLDLAERRQAQLRELRQKQDATRTRPGTVVARTMGAPPTVAQRPAPAPIVLGPGGVVIQRGPSMQRPKSTVAERPAQVDASAMIRAAEMAQAALEQKRLQERAARDVESQRQQLAATAATKRRAGGVSDVRGFLIDGDGKPVQSDQLRRLIALTEILGKPVSLRIGELGAGA